MSAAAPSLAEIVRSARAGDGRLLILTGPELASSCDVSPLDAPDNGWPIEGTFTPATTLCHRRVLERAPAAVWGWFSAYRSACKARGPGAVHRAVADLESTRPEHVMVLGDTVDDLLRRAGCRGPLALRGDVDRAWCGGDCGVVDLPAAPFLSEGRQPTPDELARLSCPRCGGPIRPGLWVYGHPPQEVLDRALGGALEATALLTLGRPSLATGLARQVSRVAAARGALLLADAAAPAGFHSLGLGRDEIAELLSPSAVAAP